MSSSTHSAQGAALPATPAMETDEILASQHIFRVVLDALSRPGSVRSIVQHPQLRTVETPAHPGVMSILIALMDHEVTLGFDRNFAAEDVSALMRRWLAVPTTDATEADFVICELPGAEPDFPELLKRGSLDYPNDGATLVVEVDTLQASAGDEWELTGPGIETSQRLTLPAGSVEFMNARGRAVEGYPPGIDLVFVDESLNIVGLPRTTRCQLISEGGK